MKYRTTLKLAVLVVLALCLIWFLEMKDADETAPSQKTCSLLWFEAELADYASFYRDGSFIECVNEHGQWFITKPIRDCADNSAIHRIFETIESQPCSGTTPLSEFELRGVSLEQMGLAKPRARLVFGNPAERKIYKIGIPSNNLNAVAVAYVQVANEPSVTITDTNILNAVPVGVDEIRDKRILRGPSSGTAALEIKFHDKPALRLQKEGSEWIITKPALTRASLPKVSKLLDSLFSARASRFISENMGDPAAYGLAEDEAILRLRVWYNGRQDAERLLFGKEADERGETIHANRAGTESVFAVDSSLVEDLRSLLGDLRDSHLYFMSTAEIRFISIEEKDNTLSIGKKGDEPWSIIKPRQWSADERVVSELVQRLNSLKIISFLEDPAADLTAYGLDNPARVIRMANISSEPSQAAQDTAQPLSTGTERALRLSGVQPGKESVYALFEGDTQLYEVSAAAAMTFSIDPLKYRDPTVLALDPISVKSIALKKDGLEEVVERQKKAWQAASPQGAVANEEAIAEILSRMAALVVSRFESSGAQNLAAYGLQPAAASITFGLAGESGVSKSLLLGSVSEDLGFYAMIRGQEAVFVLDRELVDLLLRGLMLKQ